MPKEEHPVRDGLEENPTLFQRINDQSDFLKQSLQQLTTTERLQCPSSSLINNFTFSLFSSRKSFLMQAEQF